MPQLFYWTLSKIKKKKNIGGVKNGTITSSKIRDMVSQVHSCLVFGPFQNRKFDQEVEKQCFSKRL